MTGYLDTGRSFPWCAGCGHPHVLTALDSALRRLEIPAARAAVVTDLGCVGLADPFFPTLHTVHAMHGRSVAIAAGLAMGDRGDVESSLKPIVLMGDGGIGAGLTHLAHAAQINVDVTVIVHNNLGHGMTGGDPSVMTPPCARGGPAPAGGTFPPWNLDLILAGAGAGFFARAIAPGDDLPAILREAVAHPGFASVEVFESCPLVGAPGGGMTEESLRSIIAESGLPLGIVRRDASRAAWRRPAVSADAGAAEGDWVVPEPAWGHLERAARFIVAGRAGEGVESAAMLAGRAATAAGLHVTMRDHHPETRGTGFCLTEVTVSPDPIGHTGLVNPDFALVLAPEGREEMDARGLLRAPAGAHRTVFDVELEAPPGIAVARSDLRRRFGSRGAALGGLLEEIERVGWWDRRAWIAAMDRLSEPQRAETEAVLGKAR